MSFAHDARCPHIQPAHVCKLSADITTCRECDRVVATRGDAPARILANLTTAKAEATAAGQTVRAGIIQSMIDRVVGAVLILDSAGVAFQSYLGWRSADAFYMFWRNLADVRGPLTLIHDAQTSGDNSNSREDS